MNKLPMKDTYTMRKIRGNIEEMLMKITLKSWELNLSEKRTFEVLDNIIDFCEFIDIYERNELREIFVNMLEESIEVRKNEHKKENH